MTFETIYCYVISPKVKGTYEWTIIYNSPVISHAITLPYRKNYLIKRPHTGSNPGRPRGSSTSWPEHQTDSVTNFLYKLIDKLIIKEKMIKLIIEGAPVPED